MWWLNRYKPIKEVSAQSPNIPSRAPMYTQPVLPSYDDNAYDTLALFGHHPEPTASNPVRTPEGFAALQFAMSYGRQWADVPPNVKAERPFAVSWAVPMDIDTDLAGVFYVDPNTSQATQSPPKPSEALATQAAQLALVQRFLLGSP